ncbi:MAG: hypothetical protein GIKADHBN_02026 [Phycisphaerales bacterium]|nr:hypothetical protein [Phycisphaerales bacterium]
MPVSSDVTLNGEAEPRWPDVCVLCGIEHPDGRFEFRASRVGFDQLLTLSWSVGARPKVQVPACGVCTRALRLDRRLRGVTTWIVGLAVGGAVLWLVDTLGWLPSQPRALRRWAAAGFMLLGLVPFLVWEMLRPPKVDVTAKGKNVSYEFADRSYAEMFRELNDENVRSTSY